MKKIYFVAVLSILALIWFQGKGEASRGWEDRFIVKSFDQFEPHGPIERHHTQAKGTIFEMASPAFSELIREKAEFFEVMNYREGNSGRAVQITVIEGKKSAQVKQYLLSRLLTFRSIFGGDGAGEVEEFPWGGMMLKSTYNNGVPLASWQKLPGCLGSFQMFVCLWGNVNLRELSGSPKDEKNAPGSPQFLAWVSGSRALIILSDEAGAPSSLVRSYLMKYPPTMRFTKTDLDPADFMGKQMKEIGERIVELEMKRESRTKDDVYQAMLSQCELEIEMRSISVQKLDRAVCCPLTLALGPEAREQGIRELQTKYRYDEDGAMEYFLGFASPNHGCDFEEQVFKEVWGNENQCEEDR